MDFGNILWMIKFVSLSTLFLIFLWLVFELLYKFEEHIDNMKKK